MFDSDGSGVRRCEVAERRLDELADQMRAVASQISALQARQVALAARVDNLVASEPVDLGTTTAHWLAWQVGLMPTEARRVLRLAHRLGDLPVLSEHFGSGALSQGTVETLVQVATEHNEARLVETSKVATGAQLARLVATMRRVERGRATPGDDYVNFGHDSHGRFWIRGSLTAHDGARVANAIRAAQDIDRGDGEPLGSRAEALVSVATGFLDASSVGTDIAERYQVVVRVDLDEITDSGSRITAHLPGVAPLETADLGELLCESTLSFVFERHSTPVAVAIAARFASAKQRRALLVRDGGCVFPGCGRTHFLKAHHLVHHVDGGPTSLDNMVLLCQHHHSEIHRPGWKVFRDSDGHVAFIDARGVDRSRVVCRPPGRGRQGESPPPGPRHRGTGERLTAWGADVILYDWMKPPT